MNKAMWACAGLFIALTSFRWFYLRVRNNFAYSLGSGYGNTVVLVLQALVSGAFNGASRGTEHEGAGIVLLLFAMCEGYLYSYLVKKKWKEDAEYIP
ncbi:MAG: hypothetical protein NTW01_13515 [Gammaproteobacteria bacterium]|nr:hypothetical protein [Gammaproteobacteria bacterium]